MARLDHLVDPADAWGGGDNASSYERGRPSYPREAVEHLARVLNIGPGRTVVDLGAGTGKFTRLLAATGAHVVAGDAFKATSSLDKDDLPAAQLLLAQAWAWMVQEEAALRKKAA